MRDSAERALTWTLALALLASVVGVAYLAAAPPETTDPYTEFYLLGTGGNASGYPTNLTVGETGEVVVGISNHEHERMRYTVVAVLDGEMVERRSVRVPDGETWEGTVEFTPDSPGRKRLDVLLYRERPTSSELYRDLRLFVEVREA